MNRQSIWTKRLLPVPLMLCFVWIVHSFRIPNPMVFLMIPIVYCVYSSGYIGGMLSGIVATLYTIYFFLMKTHDPAGVNKVVNIVLSIAAIVLLVGKLKAREEKHTQELKRNSDALAQMAATDKLTGAANRHAFFKMGATLYENSRRLGAPISVLFIDIDHFKQVNDLYGHGFGDAVLVRMAEVIKRCLRSSDINCRYGGEEFVVLLAHADSNAAQLVAQRVMKEVGQIRFEEYPDFQLTVSIGVSTAAPCFPRSLEHLIDSADSAMYAAKQAGRNRVVVGNPEQSPNSGSACARPAFVPMAISRCGDSDMSEQESYLMQDILLQALDQMLELVYVVDTQTYELLYINSAGREKYGIGDLKSAKCYQLMQGLDAPCSFCLNDRLAFDSIYSWEFTNPMLGRHFLLRDRLVHWKGRKARMQIATDITERESERSALKYSLEAELVIRDCIGLLYKAKMLDGVMDDVLERTGDYFGADRAYFLQPDSGVLTVTNRWCAPGLAQNPCGSPPPIWSDGWRALVQDEDCVVIKDMAQQDGPDPEIRQALRAQGIQRLVVMPLEQDGKLLGLWGMENPAPEKIRDIASLLPSLRYFLLSTMHRIEYEKLLVELSFRDSLTGLRNRNGYLQDLAGLEAVQNTGVVYIAINEMKRINDAFGHAYGDQILTGCADRIKETFPSGVAYRVSGDEFVVICKDILQERFEQHVRTFKAHCAASQNCRAAIGYQWADQADSIECLTHEAEAWMYEDKKGHYRKNLPRDRYRHYNDDIFCLTEAGTLKKRLAEGCFVIYLQPKVSFTDRTVSGAEALVRYRQEDGTVIAPAHFLPVLEDAKLIGMLDFFVFDCVCAKLAEWLGEGRAVMPISVNFSRYTLAEQDFLTRLQEVFGNYRIDKKWVIIEVTESVEGVEGMDFLALIDSLRAAGFAIAIDDFGVDFANLSLFSSANFDELKVDKTLVGSIVTNQKTQLVIASIVDICRRIGIRVVAEGVETEEQFGILKQNGCEQAQGYLFSRPIPIGEYEEKFLPLG